MNRFLSFGPAGLALALLSVCGPATAQSFTLPEIGLQASGPCRKLAVRDRDTQATTPLGCLSSGKWSLRLDTLHIPGPGSVGDVSTMSVAPDALATEGSLARILGRTGGVSPNLWVNPDGALGDGSPKVVYSDGLSIHGPDRWIFQQVTLTPFVTGQRVSAADGSSAVRMLNGYAAWGSTTIGTGTKTFTVAAGLNYAAGFPVQAVVANDPSKGMSGTIVSYNGTTLVLNITSMVGSGTFSDWVVGSVGTTKQGITMVNTTAATSDGSDTLNLETTEGVQIGANIEFAFDAAFETINGIQRGTYVVSKTATTIKMSRPAKSPTLVARTGKAVLSGQRISFYGNQGNYLYQDINTTDAVGFRYGTPEARDAWLSFDVQSFGLPNCTASMMMLGYKSASELGRSYVQSFPVTSTKSHVILMIRGDKVGAPGTWKAGYNANTWGGLWGTIGFAWESQGSPTARNIPDGEWSNILAVGGSENQTCDLTGTVGAYVDVSNVNLTLDKPTPYIPPLSYTYPAPRFEAKSPRTPRVVLNATDNAPSLRKWHSYVLPDGTYGIGKLNDDESAETKLPLRLYPDGSVNFPHYGAGPLTVGTNGSVASSAPLTVPGTSAFFTTFDSAVGAQYGVPTPARTGAKVNRINDRLLIGAATVNSGDFPTKTKDWYEQLESGDTHPLGFRTSWAQTASISTNGGIGVLGAARTSDINLPTFQLAMGGLFASYNDNTTSQQLATAFYAAAFRKDGAGIGPGAGTVGGEIDIANKGNSLKLTPANVDDPRGHTTALKLNSGAALARGANAASAGLTFGNNRGKFLTGMIFAQNAIEGVTLDGNNKAVGGEGEAMAFGAFQGMGWWVTGGPVPSAKIISRQLTAANVQEISFEDAGTYFGGPAGSGRAFATIYPGGATGSYLAAVPAFGSNAPTLTARGATNADIAIRSRGPGSVVLGSEITEYARIGAFGMKLRVVTVAQLPTCNSATRGTVSAVSDAGTPTYNATVTGGGTNSLPVYCNGTAWTMH